MNPRWEQMFGFDVPFLELVLRGTIMYLSLYVILRILVKRHVGGMGLSDLLMVVLIADASSNGMGDDYRSIPEGLVLCGTIIFWSHALDYLAYRFPKLRLLIEPAPLELIRNGRIQRRNLRQELISIDDLMSQLREQGIEDVKQVKRACLEPDGHISVIRVEHGNETTEKPNTEQKRRAIT